MSTSYSTPKGYANIRWPGIGSCSSPFAQVKLGGLNITDQETLSCKTVRGPYHKKWPCSLVVSSDFLYLSGTADISGRTTPTTHAYVQKIHPKTLLIEKKSVNLATGDHLWLSHLVHHENGYLYIQSGNHISKLNLNLEVIKEVELPKLQALDSLLITKQGNLITKTIDLEGPKQTNIFILNEDLAILDKVDIPDQSMGHLVMTHHRTSTNYIYLVGRKNIHRIEILDTKLKEDYNWKPMLFHDQDPKTIRHSWSVTLSKTDAWITVSSEEKLLSNMLAANPIGSDWQKWDLTLFLSAIAKKLKLDWLINPKNVFAPDKTPKKLTLYRFSLDDCNDQDVFFPLDDEDALCVNGPIWDEKRKILLVADTRNSFLRAFRYNFRSEGADKLNLLWEKRVALSSYPLLYSETGELVIDDNTREQSVKMLVIDISTGKTLAEESTPILLSSLHNIVPGTDRDFYLTSPFHGLVRGEIVSKNIKAN